MAGGREMTIFVIDLSPSMSKPVLVKERRFVPASSLSQSQSQSQSASQKNKNDQKGEVEEVDVEISRLEYGLRYVKSKVSHMVFRGLKTVHCEVLLFAHPQTRNSLYKTIDGYDHIYELVKMGQPSADALEALSDLEPTDLEGDALSALIVAIKDLTSSSNKTWKKNIVVVTDAEGATDWEDSDRTAEQLSGFNIQLTVVGLEFDDAEHGYKQEDKPAVKRENEKQWHSFCDFLVEKGDEPVIGNAHRAIEAATAPNAKAVRGTSQEYNLTLGDTEEDPENSLSIPVSMRKATMVARPQTLKKMSNRGGGGPPRAGPSGKKRKLVDLNEEEEDEATEDDDDGATFEVNREVKKFYVIQPDDTDQKPKIKPEDGMDEDLDEDEEGGKPDVQLIPVEDETLLTKAWKYGADLIPVEKVDEEKLKLTGEPGIEIVGFVKNQNLPREWAIGDVSYMFASQYYAHAQVSLSALIHAMLERNVVAIARYVGKLKNRDPKLAILSPKQGEGWQCLLFVQAPFAEDLRRYTFPSLDKIVNTKGQQLEKHRNIPSEEMKEAMDEFVDSMDVMNAGGSDEEGNPTPWFSPSESYNPAIHNIMNALLHRMAEPYDQGLPPQHPALTKFFEPPEKVKERSKDSVEKVKTLFDARKVPARPKFTRKRNRPGEQEEIVRDEDIFGFTGDSQPEPEASGSGTRPTGGEQLATDKSPSKPAGSGMDVDEDEETEDEDAAGPENADEAIGLKDPIGDFEKLVQVGGPGGDRIEQAVDGMCRAIPRILEGSFSRSKYELLKKCMARAREVARQEDETKTWNTFIRSFKTMCDKQELKHSDFWNSVVRKEGLSLGLITKEEDESGGADAVEAEEAEEFMR